MSFGTFEIFHQFRTVCSSVFIAVCRRFHTRRHSSWNPFVFISVALIRCYLDHYALDLDALRNVTDFPIIPTLPKGANWRSANLKGVNTEISWSKNLGRIVEIQSHHRRVVLYIHGGGGALCSPTTHRLLTHSIAARAEAFVIAPKYRRVPDYSIKESVQDCLSVYRYLVESVGVSPDAIAFCGDSAGAALTILTLASIRKLGIPLPSCAALLSPWCDWRDQRTCEENQSLDYINVNVLRYMSDLITHGGAFMELNPMELDLSGFPPLLIHYGEVEILANQILRFYKYCVSQGVRVEIKEYAGMVHVPHFFSIFTSIADSAIDDVCNFFNRFVVDS
jgi:monoterpene epsilon-lactone hydrolase